MRRRVALLGIALAPIIALILLTRRSKMPDQVTHPPSPSPTPTPTPREPSEQRVPTPTPKS